VIKRGYNPACPSDKRAPLAHRGKMIDRAGSRASTKTTAVRCDHGLLRGDRWTNRKVWRSKGMDGPRCKAAGNADRLNCPYFVFFNLLYLFLSFVEQANGHVEVLEWRELSCTTWKFSRLSVCLP